MVKVMSQEEIMDVVTRKLDSVWEKLLATLRPEQIGDLELTDLQKSLWYRYNDLEEILHVLETGNWCYADENVLP
ncbi:hypothetical protein SDD30_16040 [Moorella naiadis]|uniref:hypothetical protein n=1 Tax=Moorella naiadis (nom. illeg.) TaxID=3093670 RepID=UPI003D9C864F